jgi:hypothetical protein
VVFDKAEWSALGRCASGGGCGAPGTIKLLRKCLSIFQVHPQNRLNLKRAGGLRQQLIRPLLLTLGFRMFHLSQHIGPQGWRPAGPKGAEVHIGGRGHHKFPQWSGKPKKTFLPKFSQRC